MPNKLTNEKSPYLLQHVENPVDWRPWGPAAFAEARAQDKPVFLSIGYSTCHWCHVMAHESFEDPEAARAINQSFIPVKVDREERPDVDAVYMAACMAMNGSGGWPLTALLTADQKPFWVGTYLPKWQLLSLVEQASRLWQGEREKALETGEQLTAYLQKPEQGRPGAPSRALVSQGVAHFADSFDAAWGGFGSAPKFPTPHHLLFLSRYAQLTGDTHAGDMAEKTLEGMYRGGLFDHIGGGFSRYSTDERWLVPHFEKMLYDNALLVLAYAEGYQRTGRPVFGAVVRRTLDYVLTELRSPEGGFYCGQDADSDGVEGKYYVWTPGELSQLLQAGEADAFCARFGITQTGNFEGKSIPSLLANPAWEEEPAGMEGIRRQLYEHRTGRTALHKDDKVLTAWNGLMLAALARAGLVMGESRYLEAARRAADFVRRALTGSDGRLLARWREGEAAHPGKLDDYALYAWGLLELYGATFMTEYLDEAARLAGLMLDQFFDGEMGGFFPYAAEGEQLISRTKEVYDGAMPSGNSVAALVLSRLARLTGEMRWRAAAELQLGYLAGGMQGYPMGHSFALLVCLEELWPSAELVCATVADEAPQVLMDVLRQGGEPNLTVLLKTPKNALDLARIAPFTEPYPCPEEGARYYLCRNGACAQPVETIQQLLKLLDKD